MNIKKEGGRKIVIAIDGYSSSGKSSFAKAIAAELGYVFIDTGAMYRAVTLYAQREGAITPDCLVDRTKVVEMLGSIDIEFRFNPKRESSDIYVNGECVEREIREIGVSRCVSEVSSIGEVREKLVAMQQQMGAEKGVVMDGRDIGTVVFPDAEFKIFLTADPKVRAQRRYDELTARGDKVSLEEIESNIRERDRRDETRDISPLRKADDALVLDNSYMTPSQQMEWVEERLREFFPL